MRQIAGIKGLYIIAAILILISIPSCQKDNTIKKSFKADSGLQINEIELTENIIEGLPIGVDFEIGVVYIKSILRSKRSFLISIIDIDSLNTAKHVELPAGNYQSPTEYFSPVHVEIIDKKYYVVDQFEKIVVYDKDFNHLYSSMYSQLRFFIDLFEYDNQIFFLVGSKNISKTVRCRVKLYRLIKDKKPIETMNLSPPIDTLSIYNKFTDNRYIVGYFWPSVHGFEKDGCIYYGTGNNKDIVIYNLRSKKKEIYSLSYLKSKKYQDKDAVKLGYHNTDGWEEKHYKRFGEKIIYEAYPHDMYHFGIFDIGSDKIGVAGDVNLDKMKFRLDIINIKSREYKESIWLPIGYGFKNMLSTHYRGLSKGYINVDRGIYIFHDTVGEDFDHVVKVIKFKVK